MDKLDKIWKESERVYPSDKEECGRHIDGSAEVWCNYCNGISNDDLCILGDSE